jgi:hypothetical protein
MNSSTTFKVALQGSAAGSGFDQLASSDQVSLGNATLSPSLSGFTPTPGEQFPIITSQAPTSGIFSNLPEGASLMIGGVPFTITYKGGSGDDVVLTQATSSRATTTTLQSSANPSILNQPVTFTAIVAPSSGSGTPTGDVMFTVDSVPQTATLQTVGTMQEASLPPISNFSPGPHTITASYAGDASFAPSTAMNLTQTVNKIPTMTTLQSSANPSNVGEAVTFTAFVAPTSVTGTPTGDVSFTVDNGSPVMVALQSMGGKQEASLPAISNLSTGQHTITATYGGDETFATSTATPPLTQSVGLAATTTTLSSSLNPSNAGQGVTFTAIVAPNSGSGTPTGEVSFTVDNGTPTMVTLQPVGSKQEATLGPLTNLSVGHHTIGASYGGDSTFATSTATPVTQTVNGIGTTTSVASSLNPSQFGQSVTFTATVTPTASAGTLTPTGMVTFLDGTATLGTGQIGANDQATFMTSSLGGGMHSITAQYAGDSNFSGSTSTAPVTQTVQVNTSTSLMSSLNPSVANQPVTFTATVTAQSGGGNPTGTVDFDDGTSQIGMGTIGANGQATFTDSTLSAGTHSITAHYVGTATFLPSVSSPPLVQTVLVPTTTSVASSLNPSLVGQSVTFTATVAIAADPPAAGPTGTVDFLDGATMIGSGTLGSNDQATFTTSTLAAGTHPITAVYTGDSMFAGSTSSPPLDQVVNKQASTTTLTSSANPSTFGQPVVFTAIVAPATSGMPTGSVIFTVDDQAGSLVPLTSVGGKEQATFTTSTLAGGMHSVTAAYSGDGTFASSTSSEVTQTVNPAATTVSLAVAPNPATVGQAVALSATVSGTPTPSGTVTFEEGTTVLGTSAVNSSGVATLTTSTLAAGTHTLTAAFNGSTNFAASTSSNVSAVINPVTAVPPTVTLFQRFGFHAQPTILVLTFSEALAPGPAQDVGNYTIVLQSGHAPGGVPIGGTIAVSRAVYNPTMHTVGLYPAKRLNVHDVYQLTVNGMTPTGLTGATGLPLAGANHQAGTNYVAPINFSTLAGSSNAAFLTIAQRLVFGPPSVSPQAIDHLAVTGELGVRRVGKHHHH